MLKPIVAATAALAIAGSTLVYAQQRFDGRRDFGADGPGAGLRHYRLTPEDVNAFADARIAALKAGLELSPDQAKNWPAFETALRNMVQIRLQLMQARQAAQQQPPSATTPFDRLARWADIMSKRSAALKQIADTGTPLYQSLDDAQKHRFAVLSRMLRPHFARHAMNGGPGGWRQGPGFRPNDRDGWGPHGRRFGQNSPGMEQDGPDWRQGDRLNQGDHGSASGLHDLLGDDGDQGEQL